jgi:polar amino acid transport system permease protein
MDAVIEARNVLIGGFWVNIQLFAASSLLMLIVSFAAGLARLSGSRTVRGVAAVYVNLFRGTSLVVQLFWLYYALPMLGIRLEAFPAAVIGLGLCFGAYASEVVRAGLLAVGSGQREAALALNMTRTQIFARVLMPQAIVVMLPGYTNLLILLLQATAAASLITLQELTFRAGSLNAVTFNTAPIFLTVLVAYFLFAQAVARALRELERRLAFWRWPRARTA